MPNDCHEFRELIACHSSFRRPFVVVGIVGIVGIVGVIGVVAVVIVVAMGWDVFSFRVFCFSHGVGAARKCTFPHVATKMSSPPDRPNAATPQSLPSPSIGRSFWNL